LVARHFLHPGDKHTNESKNRLCYVWRKQEQCEMKINSDKIQVFLSPAVVEDRLCKLLWLIYHPEFTQSILHDRWRSAFVDNAGPILRD